MIPVGGANGLIDRLLTLLSWRATSTIADAERVDALNCLNWAEKFITLREAMLFKNYTWSISVLTNQTKIDLTAAPFLAVGFDFSKDHILIDGNGMPLDYCSLDEFHRLSAASDAVFPAPSGYIVSIDSSDAKRKLLLDEAQPANATFTLHGQRLPADLTDSATSYSILPEGRELTLLLPVAEQFAKQRGRELDSSMLDAQTRDSLEKFFAEQRANKLTTATDANRERRMSERTAAHATGEK